MSIQTKQEQKMVDQQPQDQQKPLQPSNIDTASLPCTFQSHWRSNPDPTALPFPRDAPPFALTPIDWHQLSVPDSQFTPHSWRELQHLISTDQLEHLKRWPSQLKAYLAWTAHVKGKWGSATEYLLEQRLGWERFTSNFDGEGAEGSGALVFRTEGKVAFEHAEDFTILRNDWPYAFEDGIRHVVVWSKIRLPVDRKTGVLSEEGKRMVEEFVSREFRRKVGEGGEEVRGSKVLWFKNGTNLQSVRSLEHVHVLLRGVEEDVLGRWMV